MDDYVDSHEIFNRQKILYDWILSQPKVMVISIFSLKEAISYSIT